MSVILTVLNSFTDNLLIDGNGDPTTFTVSNSPYTLSEFYSNDEVRSSQDMQSALSRGDASISVNGVNINNVETLGTNKLIEASDMSGNSGILTNYVDSQNENSQSTNSIYPNLSTYLSLVASGIDMSSDYRFELSFSIGINVTNKNAVVDVKDFGTSILPQRYTVEQKDNTNRTWISISGRITPNPLGAGQIQLQLDFGADASGALTTMYFANISLSKIN